LSFVPSEIQLILYSIWRGDDRDQTWECYKRTFGERRKKQSILNKRKEIEHSLLKTLVGMSEAPVTTPEPLPKELNEKLESLDQCYEFMKPVLSLINIEIEGKPQEKAVYAINTRSWKNVKVTFNRITNLTQWTYLKFDFAGTMIEGKQQLIFDYIVDRRYKILGGFNHEHWKGVEVCLVDIADVYDPNAMEEV